MLTLFSRIDLTFLVVAISVTLLIMIHMTFLLVLMLVLGGVAVLAGLVVLRLTVVLVVGGVEGVAHGVVAGVALGVVLGLVAVLILHMTFLVVVCRADFLINGVVDCLVYGVIFIVTLLMTIAIPRHRAVVKEQQLKCRKKVDKDNQVASITFHIIPERSETREKRNSCCIPYLLIQSCIK